MEKNEDNKRSNALMAAEIRRLRSLPPKPTCVEEAQDKMPFSRHVNEIRGEKHSEEALKILQLLYKIASDTRRSREMKLPQPRVRASNNKFQSILRCQGARELFLTMGFRMIVDEMEEKYIIPLLAGRPEIALTLLNTGIMVLEEEINRMEAETQIRKEMAEKERLAPLAAKEKALKNIEDDRRRMKEKRRAPVKPRYKATVERLDYLEPVDLLLYTTTFALNLRVSGGERQKPEPGIDHQKLMTMAVSPTHSRPGLAMTFEELNQAKVLILDLLGCGLSPENLVEAGISKQCLVPCLRELKLRLPSNIDLSDVVFFDPPSDTNSPSHPPTSPKNDTRQPSHLNDDHGMHGARHPFPRGPIDHEMGAHDRFDVSERAYVAHSRSASATERLPLLDRMAYKPRGWSFGGKSQYNNLPESEYLVEREPGLNGASAEPLDASSLPTDTPSMPPRGPKKQGKNFQGGRPPPVSRRKMQGHAVIASSRMPQLD